MYKNSRDQLVMKSKDYNQKSDLSHLYYNISIKNTGDNTTANYIPDFYNEQLAEPILVSGSNQYQMTVNRFSIPSSLIPIQIIPIQNNQSDPDLTIYSFTITINGASSQEFIKWIPETIYAGSIPPAPSTTPTQTQAVSPYYYLYDFSKFIDLMNTAVRVAMTSNTNYNNTMFTPTFVLNSDLTISLLCDSTFSDANSATSGIYMNNALSQVLSSFFVDYVSSSNVNGLDVRFRVLDQQYNLVQKPNTDPTTWTYPPPLFKMSQEYSSLADFNNITRLVFTSNTLPIRAEFTPLSIPFGLVSTNNFFNPNPSYTSIITDFSLSSSNTGVDNLAGNLVYSASGNNCRMIDLLSQNPIKIIDLNIYFVDSYDNLYPLLIPFNNSVNVKLEFRLKEAIN